MAAPAPASCLCSGQEERDWQRGKSPYQLGDLPLKTLLEAPLSESAQISWARMCHVTTQYARENKKNCLGFFNLSTLPL